MSWRPGLRESVTGERRALRAAYLLPLILLTLALYGIGCEYNISTNPDVSLVQVTVSPGAISTTPASSLTLAATVRGYKHDSSVFWAIVSGGGSLTTNGNKTVFHAPDSLSAFPAVTIVRATSSEDTSRHADAAITIVAPQDTTSQPINIILTPLAVSLQAGQTQQFQTTVTGTTNQSVTWKIVSGDGTLSSTGLFSAPATITATSNTVIQVTSLADTSVWAQATVTLQLPVDNTPCFSRDVLPILVSNCAMSGCHNATDRKEGYDFTSYDGVMRAVRAGNARTSRLYTAITKINGDDRMPPPPQQALSSAQVQTIGDWIDAGALNTDCSSTSGPCDTIDVRYSSFVKGVVQNYCLGCHNAGVSTSNIDLSTPQALAAMAQTGHLMGSLNQLPGYQAMPQGLPKLDDCTLAKIQAWVNQGSPNN